MCFNFLSLLWTYNKKSIHWRGCLFQTIFLILKRCTQSKCVHGEVHQTSEVVTAQAACAVPPWWLRVGHVSAPMWLQIKLNEHHVHKGLTIHEHRQGNQLSTAPASAVLGNSPATRQCLVPIWGSKSTRTDKIQNSQKWELVKFATVV